MKGWKDIKNDLPTDALLMHEVLDESGNTAIAYPCIHMFKFKDGKVIHCEPYFEGWLIQCESLECSIKSKITHWRILNERS